MCLRSIMRSPNRKRGVLWMDESRNRGLKPRDMSRVKALIAQANLNQLKDLENYVQKAQKGDFL